MKILCAFLLLVLCVIELQQPVTALRGARGGSRGGGYRGGSRGGGYRGGSRGGSRGSRGSTKRRQFSPSGTTRVTKYTHIPVRTKSSPVIVKQTKVRSRPNLATKVFVGYMFYRYTLGTGPVYRSRYPLYYSEVVIPEERAIRVNFTREEVLDSKGNACLGPTQSGIIAKDSNITFIVFTIVRYGGEKPKEIHYLGANRTVNIDKSVLDSSIEVTTLVFFNGTIIPNTNCTRLHSVVNGTVIRMYATNPDKVAQVNSSILIVILSCIVLFILLK